MKKSIIKILTVALLIVAMMTQGVAAANFSTAPKVDQTGDLIWKTQFGEMGSWGMTNTSTPPLVVGNYVYVGQDKHLIKMDATTGKVVAKSEEIKQSSNSYNNYYGQISPVASTDGKTIYLAVTSVFAAGGAGVAAFDANTLAMKWINTDAPIGSNQRVMASDITVYNDGTKDIIIVGDKHYTQNSDWTETFSDSAFSIIDGETGGDIFANEIPTAVFSNNKAAVFKGAGGNIYTAVPSSDGMVRIFNLSDTEESETKILIGKEGYIPKGGITIDGDSMYLTLSSTSGAPKLMKLSGLNSYNGAVDYFNGKTSEVVLSGTYTTGTPAISNGYAFVGAGSGDFSNPSGYINIVRLSNMTKVQSIEIENNQQGDISLYASGNTIDAYSVPNGATGGLYQVTFNTGTEKVDFNGFAFTPDAADRNYSTSHVQIDAEGSLYYKNDSGYVFKISKEVEEELVLKGKTIEIIKGSSLPIEIRIDMEFSKFREEVRVNGALLVPGADYGLREGSTIITLTSEYVKNMGVGTHEVQVMFEGAVYQANIVVTSASDIPQTGDNAPLVAMTVIGGVAIVGIVGLLIMKKRKTKNTEQ